ncbi:sodium:proton antiporter [Haladaptatus sp. W1]|uniref:cation:proton antiporter n=1 Tax=Haladaptatus sp. W1 TaxID=1897478 RepID=UPI000849AF75|nr:cation:proton antiporter [Haladaptatus sp. W1]ODR79938.1 sodium:proton antiporter [Haladaptatus sp. W1]
MVSGGIQAAGSLESHLFTLLAVFVIAGVVGTFTTKVVRIPYTVGLVLAGLAVSVLDLPLTTPLSNQLILLVILPTLIFQSAMNIDTEQLREDVVPILVLAVVGLVVSVAIVGIVGSQLLGLSVAVALLLGAIAMPTDPVSVVALFEDLGAPERLSVLTEGESILNDGVGIVLYSVLLSVLLEARIRDVTATELITPSLVVRDVGFGIVIAMVGGAFIGLVAGYVAYRLLILVDQPMTGIVFTVVLAYGVYVLAEHLDVSGVIAVLGAGLVVGTHGTRDAVSARTRLTLGTVWASAAFIANTVIFVAIGVATPLDLLERYAGEILVAVVLVFLARAVVVYPLVALLNRRFTSTIPRSYQHVMVWGGIHASVPIALVLGLPRSLPVALREELSAIVFGVAAVTLVVNGLTMGRLIERLGIVIVSAAERQYELLMGRLHGVNAALAGAEELHERDDISSEIYENIDTRYTSQKRRLNRAISTLLDEHPHLREKEGLTAEAEVVRYEIVGIKTAMERGIVSTEVGNRLLEETERRLEHIDDSQYALETEDENHDET